MGQQRERGSTREREEEREATMASMGHQKTLKKQYSSAGSSNSRTRSSSLPEKRKDEPRDWRKALRSESTCARHHWSSGAGGEWLTARRAHQAPPSRLGASRVWITCTTSTAPTGRSSTTACSITRRGARAPSASRRSTPRRSLGSERGTTLDPAESHLPLAASG